jgi:PKD repeat protein/predicted phosphodiesterase
MAMRRGVCFIVGVLLLANLTFIYAVPDDVNADATYVDILQPIISVPVIQESGGDIIIEVDSDATSLSNWNVTIETEHDSFSLVMNEANQGTGTWELNLTIPPTVRADLYDLTVIVDGEVDKEPHAVSVVSGFRDEFSFIQMTDIHIKDSPSANEDNLKKAIKEANLIRPEFVIITGDIGDNPEGVGQNEVAQYERVYDLLLMFDVPVYVVNGNHDYDSDLFEPSPIHVYRDIINPFPDFSFNFGEYHFVGMDSGEKTAYYGLPGCMMGTGLTNAQISWLESDLEAHSSSKQRFIFMHHTTFDPDKVYEMGFNWNSSISQNQQEFLEISNQHDVSMVLTGHTHLDEVWDKNGNKQTGGSTAHPPTPLYVQTRATGKGNIGEVGYRLVRVNGTTLDSYTYDWDGNGFRDADKSMPSYDLDLSYSPSNNGSSRKVTATITNNLRESFSNAFLEFVMPKPSVEYETTITNGSIDQIIETQDSIIYYVRADLPMLTTMKVVLLQNLVPIASFNHTPISPTTSDTIVFNDSSMDLDGIISEWLWDFGDGTTSTQHSPTHSYSEIDSYTVTLTVWDKHGGSDSISKTIVIGNRMPVAGFSYTPHNPNINEVITFTDESYDPEGSVVEWEWDFGDGTTSAEENPTYSYSETGFFIITLTVWDEYNDSDSISKIIEIENFVENLAPNAGFSHSPDCPMISAIIAFTDESFDPDGSIVTWEWDFGDGTTSNEHNPTHAYSESGLFTVTLTVWDEDSSSNITSRVISVVEIQKPVAEFSFLPGNPVVNELITFRDKSSDPDGLVVAWEWDFGDGNYATTQNPVHRYSHPGNYIVKLTVTDGEGAQDTTTATITVHEEAVESGQIFHFPLYIILVIPILLILILYGWKRRKRSTQDH